MFFSSKNRSANQPPARASAAGRSFAPSFDTPEQEVDDVPFMAPIGIWNGGAELIVHPNAAFPPRCVYSNAPCDEGDRQSVTWQSNAMLPRRPRRMKFTYFVSRRARRSHLTLMIAGLAIFLLGLGSFGLTLKFLMTQWPLFILILSGAGLLFLGVLIMWIALGVIRVERSMPPYFAMTGCGDDFMKSFPYSDELIALLPKYMVDKMYASGEVKPH